MDAKDLLWFSSGFRTVAAWRNAMFAHGYTIPVQLCHGLSGAMKRLTLKFPEAFRLLWDQKKIGVSGRGLLYDPSASMLWDAGGQLSGSPLAGPARPDIPWDRDVLTLVPPPEEIVYLESLWCLAPSSSPLMKLALWRPIDEFDQIIRECLHDFGDDALAVTWKSVDRQQGARGEQPYTSLKELAFKDELTGLDDLKSINEDLGYAAGDATLRGMAEILLRHTRGINVICRYDGDRFAVLLVETSKAGARLYADRIRYVLSSSQYAHRRRMTASFGIASLPEDVAPTAENLLLAADRTLSAAKNRIAVSEDKKKLEPSCE
jgi:diguanylate cyclase (GGDEF)-like protein